MLFNEPRFIAFLLLVFSVFWSLKSNRNRKVFLLLASYFFYGCWDWRFLGLILLSSVTSYVASLLIEQSEDRPFFRSFCLAWGIGIGLGVLFVFKYYNFFSQSIADVASMAGISVAPHRLNVILPVGISFFTFQSVSYVLDTYLHRSRATRNIIDYLLYVAFFPQLVAGPIVRATDFLPQLSACTSFSSVRWRPALSLFVIGYFKKAVISDNIAPLVDGFFLDSGSFGHWDALLAVVLYAVQIYCDFSGYSDMGIAVAAFLGYRLCVNFDHPYFATNVAMFWRKWHISLSTWLRDYLYIPLGGNRKGGVRTVINLMLTMLLGGIWHGAAWTFVVWGLLHGLGLVVHRAWVSVRGKVVGPGAASWFGTATGWLLTMTWVLLTWVFFRSPSMSVAIDVLQAVLFGGTKSRILPQVFWLHLVLLAILHAAAWKQRWVPWIESIPTPVFLMLLSLSVAACLSLVPNGYRPFIYFQF